MGSTVGLPRSRLLLFTALAVIVATIAIPTVFRPKQPSNEADAVAFLRKVNTAEATYRASSGHYGTMTMLVESGLVDSGALRANSGYVFSVNVESDGYLATATPQSEDTGRYEYYSRQDGVVHYSHDFAKAPPAQAGNPVF
jgi:hypothetical protein